jgi:hypothetical protein
MSNKKGIGYSPLTDKVYLGTQNQEKGMWVGNKVDITNEFLAVASSYFTEGTVRDISCGNQHNLFCNFKKDKVNLKRAINHFQKILNEIEIKELNK